MTEHAPTIDFGSWPELPPAARVLVSPTYPDGVVKAEAEEREESEVRKALRELSAPPPYFYGGRRKRCFFPQKKTRWRKG